MKKKNYNQHKVYKLNKREREIFLEEFRITIPNSSNFSPSYHACTSPNKIIYASAIFSRNKIFLYKVNMKFLYSIWSKYYRIKRKLPPDGLYF